MNHKGTVRLETERLVLRRFVPEDREEIFRNCWCDPEVWQWTNYAPMACMEDMGKAGLFTESWFRAYDRSDRYSWAIQLKATGEVIGRMFGMHPDDRVKQVELAYEMGKKWWNRGLMTEAVQEVLAFFFHNVGMNRVWAYHADGNPASGRVMQKCGMQYEGTLRQGCVCNKGTFDAVVYGVLAEDIL